MAGQTSALDIMLPGESISQRERKREREREREREKEGERDIEREKDVEYGCFIFNTNDGCLGTF
jgi:hypothetical protein